MTPPYPYDLVLSIIGIVFASSGFWTFVTHMISKREEKNNTQAQMLKGLGHDRICYLGGEYIKQGYITKADYENLYDYLYIPYRKLGGNGTAEKVMKEVDKLPIKEEE